MRDLEPVTLPTAASQLVSRPRVGRLGSLVVSEPQKLARLAGLLAVTLGALSAVGLGGLGAGLQTLVFTAGVFGSIHLGLGKQARWSDTLSGALLGAFATHFLVPKWAAFGLLLVGAGAGWAAAAGVRDAVTRASVVLGVSLATVVGFLVGGQLGAALLPASLIPPVFGKALTGALIGAMMGLGTVPRHLPLERDPVELMYEEARVLPGAEMRDYVERSMRLYRQICRCLTESIPLAREADLERFREELTQLMTATFRLARRWREIELFLDQADSAATNQRLAGARAKLEGLADPYARRQYEQVAASLERRLQHLEEMSQGRERVVGSLSYYFTTLEDMHLSLMRLKATDAQSASLELNSLAGRVRALEGEVEATARSVEELDFGAPAGRLPPG